MGKRWPKAGRGRGVYGLFLVGLWVVLPRQGARAAIVINEIMYNPTGGSESNTEYVEFYNTDTGNAVTLTNWKFQDSGSSSPLTFTSEHTIAAGGYLIVTNANSESGFRTSYPTTPVGVPIVLYEMALINEPNGTTTEELTLWDNLNNVHDTLIYDDTTPWPTDQDGHSIELLSPTADNSLGSNWEDSHVTGGITPGARNSVVPEAQTWLNFLVGLILGGAYYRVARRRKERRHAPGHA